MNINDVVALSKAGFTSAQIVAMMEADKNQNNNLNLPKENIANPAPSPAPIKVKQPEQTVPVPPVQSQKAAPDGTKDILEAIKGLTDTIQASAIGNSQQPKVESTDEILASIIAPKAVK